MGGGGGSFGRVMGCEWGECPWALRMLKHWPGEGRRQTGKLPITVDTQIRSTKKIPGIYGEAYQAKINCIRAYSVKSLDTQARL